MIKSAVKLFLRNYYKKGNFYKIPFGPNKGLYFEYDTTTMLNLMLGIHEPNTFSVCRQVLDKGMTVLDLGANHGYLSIFFARQVGPLGRVYAFEPMPDNFSILERTVEKNNFKDIIIPIKAAVSNLNGPVKFYQAKNHLMSSLDVKWAGEESGHIMVSAVTIDSFFEDKDRGPDFIKMDIEGGGIFALEGMAKVIEKYKPCLLLESHTPGEDKAIGHALAYNDYNVYRVGSRVEIKELYSDHTNPYGVYGTVFGVPKNSPLISKLRPERFQKYRIGQK